MDSKDIESSDYNDLIRILLSKLESSSTLVDAETKQPVKINEDGELLVASAETAVDKWSIIIPNTIPELRNSYFWYYKNTEEETVTFTDFKFQSTLDGVYTTNIYIHRVSGDPEFKNDMNNKFVKITNTDVIPKAIIKTAATIDNLDDLGIVDKLNLHTKFKIEHLKTTIELAPNEAICLRWEEPNGALTGIVILSKVR